MNSSHKKGSCSDLQPFCRICRCEATFDDPLIAPCKCKGSIGFIHRSCLQDWIAHSSHVRALDSDEDFGPVPVGEDVPPPQLSRWGSAHTDIIGCELCGHPFRCNWKLRSWRDWQLPVLTDYEKTRLQMFFFTHLLAIVDSQFALRYIRRHFHFSTSRLPYLWQGVTSFFARARSCVLGFIRSGGRSVNADLTTVASSQASLHAGSKGRMEIEWTKAGLWVRFLLVMFTLGTWYMIGLVHWRFLFRLLRKWRHQNLELLVHDDVPVLLPPIHKSLSSVALRRSPSAAEINRSLSCTSLH
mmetsp:Transcript_16800/g.42916  ORF Transcript_16800/g.42916 Transcript_16800/m.42916 type:complete len:299 (+) Transcript_16800:123-1019(+)